MSDTAIAAIAASGVALGVAIIMLVLAIKLADARADAGAAQVDAATKAGQLAIAAAANVTLTNALNAERTRADALDDELDKAATTADPAGAQQRVLARYRAARATAVTASGGSAQPVPAKPTAAGA